VLEPIIKMIRHANNHVRVAAIDATAALEGFQAREQLRESLEDTAWNVRRAAAEALGRLKDSGAIDKLSVALKDSDADVREAVARALGSIGERAAITPLVLALRDPSSGVRRIASGALSRLDEEWSSSSEARAAYPALKSGLENEDSEVRHFVGQLLQGLGETSGGLSPWKRSGDGDSAALRRQKLAISLFTASLCDWDRDLRQASAEALGRLGDKRAEGALTRALEDPDPGVRYAVEQSLQWLRGIQEQLEPTVAASPP
jgi:HEAT repeat protein